ncbi:methylase of polypeptide subunit release factors [Arthrobacter pigmenti]|uniref:Methylase of polypeptide subunit release factors n=2 Tax=Arthrobacter pigmenti TaxID=271432 RepID=A0A846RPA3_9MICC|nr:methylase of polypeptide subunit release factors [Arthrobacter pigmenti]
MMNFASVPDAPQSTDQDMLNRLAADLRAASYTVDGVATLIGPDAYAALDRDQAVPALLAARAAREDAAEEDEATGQLAVVVLLFLLGEALPGQTLDTAFPGTGAAGLRALGLVEEHDDGGTHLRAAVDLRPYSSDTGGDLWVASDLGSRLRPGVLRADHVLGIGQASLTLARFAARTPVERALDLGTGCGIQTYHLLAHSDHVTATDLSARALAVTRFNLLLNAKALDIDPANLEERVSLRQGSLLEPVAGETFDQVVSNPPFVITPRIPGEAVEDQFTYRDGGLPGDDIVSTLIRTLPSVLVPGGTAQLLGNWEIPDGAAWHARIAGWLPEHTDAWVVQREQLTPTHYAETWLRDAAENRDPARFADRFGAYLSDFESRNAGSIGFGMVWLRNAGSPAALRRLEEITYELDQPIGPHVGAAVARHDWLGQIGNLADEHLLVAEDVTEERHQRPGAEHPGVILLRQGAGFRRTNLLTTELAGFVSACDGDLTAGQIIGALAALLERNDDGFRADLLGDVRNLVEEGFLVPALMS